MAHPNEELLRKGYNAYHRGNVDEVMGFIADDIGWHESGTSPISGDYKGKDEVLAFFGKKMELSGGTFQQETHDVIANDEHVVGLVKFRAQRSAKTLEMSTVQVWHVQGGKLSECWEHHQNLHAWDDFWS